MVNQQLIVLNLNCVSINEIQVKGFITVKSSHNLKAGANASNISSNILVRMLDECWMKIRMLHEIEFCI